jgi:hydrogenase 3 maturation protease
MRGLERWIEGRVRGRRVAVLGVGNRLRGDDAAGPRVVERLGMGGGWMVLDAGTVPENFLGLLLDAAPDVALFVDALDHGAPAGAWCALDHGALAARAPSTHAPSLRLLAELLCGHGIECWLIGIQPRTTALGAGLSPPVAAAVTAVATSLAAARERGRPAASRPAPEVRHA